MIENIFINIKRPSSLEIYEKHFNQVTNKDYKEYLVNEYITKDKSKPFIAEYLGVSPSIIQTHLSKYEIKKPKKHNSNNIFYKTPKMIEKETGRKFIDIYNELYEQGMSQTEITSYLKIKSISAVSGYLFNEREKEIAKEVGDSKLIIQGLKGKKPETVEFEFENQLNITYKDFLQQKYIEEGLSLGEISLLIGLSTRRILDHIHKYGLKKTLGDARKDAIKHGRIDIDALNRKGRKTRMKNKSGSNKQDMFRELLKINFETIAADFPGIEIVTGYNEYSILTKYEIDIPIVIFYNNRVIKIALEYDGDIWHDNKETDQEKELFLSDKQWILIRVEEKRSESNNLQILENKTNEVIEKIKDIIINI